MKTSIKKILTLALLLIGGIAVHAQDIQIHYDFGRNMYPNDEAGRQKVTVTLEQFKADRLGSWYYFCDLDLSSKFFKGAYAEISREFNLGKDSPFAAHLEYDGGLNLGGSFQHAALLGAAWNGHNADFTTTYSVQLMYKHYFHSYVGTRSYASVQLTGVWSMMFCNKALTFSGFIDFWRGEKANHNGQLVILAEPQLWYNFNTLPRMHGINLSIGTEWEISNNFVYNQNPNSSTTFFVNPTLALKWSF